MKLKNEKMIFFMKETVGSSIMTMVPILFSFIKESKDEYCN